MNDNKFLHQAEAGFFFTVGLIVILFAIPSVLGDDDQVPHPLSKEFNGVGFVELKSELKIEWKDEAKGIAKQVREQFRIRHVPKEEISRPGREVAVVYVAKEFVRLQDIHRRADGSIDKFHTRQEWWIPYESIIEVVDQFPSPKGAK